MKVTNVYNLKDYVNINDDHSSIRGYVVMTDENGKTLFAKNNMIVKAGRDIIKNCVANSVFGLGDGNALTFTAIKFGNDNSVTKSQDTDLYAPIQQDITNRITTTKKSEDRCIILTTTIRLETGDSDIIISEAGLFCDTTMFSRVAFAPLTIRPETTYTLNYYIYF